MQQQELEQRSVAAPAVRQEEHGRTAGSDQQEQQQGNTMLAHTKPTTVTSRPNGTTAVTPRSVGVRPAPSVATHAAAGATAWQSWDKWMATRKPVDSANTTEKKYFLDIASMISKSAVGYKPKFTVPHEPHTSTFKLQHVDKIQIKELPKDLHDKLETIGVATLKGATSLEGELDYGNVCFTTTDIDGALSVTGLTLQKGTEKNAVVVFVATETEREASWSRLDGLILHWACGTAAGGPWSMPPEGWSAVPGKPKDAGGAWQCQFEKQTLGDNEKMYVLVMQLPLRGILKSGGLVFVLKATANQTDKWLKDADTEKDFYLDLQKLPVTKL